MYKYTIIFCLFLYSCGPDDVTTTFEDGTTKEVYSVNKEGKKEGVYKLFRENGSLQEESNFKNDQLSGERKIYFPDGKVVEVLENYVEGKMEGDLI